MTAQLSDGELRRAYEALMLARQRAATPLRMPLERMLDLVERRGSDTERLATLDAIMSDTESVREFELLRALADAERGQRASGWRTPRAWLAAAAAILIVAIPIGRLVTRAPGREPMRSALQGALLVTPAEMASAAESRTFVWHPVAGARAYQMELLTAGGSPVFTTRSADTAVTLPRDVTVAANLEYRWWVSTEMADGTHRPSVFRRLVVRDAR